MMIVLVCQTLTIIMVVKPNDHSDCLSNLMIVVMVRPDNHSDCLSNLMTIVFVNQARQPYCLLSNLTAVVFVCHAFHVNQSTVGLLCVDSVGLLCVDSLLVFDMCSRQPLG